MDSPCYDQKDRYYRILSMDLRPDWTWHLCVWIVYRHRLCMDEWNEIWDSFIHNINYVKKDKNVLETYIIDYVCVGQVYIQ